MAKAKSKIQKNSKGQFDKKRRLFNEERGKSLVSQKYSEPGFLPNVLALLNKYGPEQMKVRKSYFNENGERIQEVQNASVEVYLVGPGSYNESETLEFNTSFGRLSVFGWKEK